MKQQSEKRVVVRGSLRAPAGGEARPISAHFIRFEDGGAKANPEFRVLLRGVPVLVSTVEDGCVIVLERGDDIKELARLLTVLGEQAAAARLTRGKT